jgi:hypothetical protein
VDRPACSNYINHKNDGGNVETCCAVTERKLLTSPGIADTYRFLMNTWNTPLESYQETVYNNNRATVKRQMQPPVNPMPAMVISMESACVDNAILLEYLASEVALEEPDIESTDRNIPQTTFARMTNFISGFQGAAGITKM